jgi:hypothetical protein
MATENIYIPKEGALAALAAWIAATLGPVAARLYANDVAYNPDRTLADYTEASFSGYSAVDPITWGTPFTNGDGKAEVDSAACSWTFTGGSGTAIVYGILLTDSANTVLMAVIPFVPAITLSPGSPTVARTIQLTDVSEL